MNFASWLRSLGRLRLGMAIVCHGWARDSTLYDRKSGDAHCASFSADAFLQYTHDAGPLIALALEECEAAEPTFGHAVAGLELRNGKAVVLLSQAIPEPAGHVHHTLGVEVGRTIGP